MSNAQDPWHLTEAERRFIEEHIDHLSREEVRQQLIDNLKAAVAVEQATIPIYLYSYYSLNRDGKTGENITPIYAFSNKAGASIMSVAVEEMLHMSLAANILFSLTGEPPQLYLNSPGSYPTGLPLHQAVGPAGPEGQQDAAVSIPLAKFGYEQLWHFLQIERPETPDALPQDKNWQTIGQFYAYIRCLIHSRHLSDEDFQVGSNNLQVQAYDYSPNNIDTVSAKEPFNPWKTPSGELPPDTQSPSRCPSAAHAAKYSNAADSHAGKTQLMTVANKEEALTALLTICDQGEGSNLEAFDDPSHQELSHYFKFLSLQAQMEPYLHRREELVAQPEPPCPIEPTIFNNQLDAVVHNFPENPTTMDYLRIYQDSPQTRINYKPLADLCNGLYQYMFIMTETLYKISGSPGKRPIDQKQRVFFNKGLHMSMIWILDKMIGAMRRYGLGNGQVLAPTFENINLGQRQDAFSNLQSLCSAVEGTPYYADIEYLCTRIRELPDISEHWGADAGVGQPVPAPYPYKAAPKFPKHPPTAQQLPPGMPLHACMGLNSCKGTDRFANNACAGQGYCSTTTDHSCHVTNDCRNQGGCGLYGTGEEMNNPGNNDCKSMGSCATPINAERFSTNGPNQGKSVWKRARQVFEEQVYPQLRDELQANGVKAPLPERLGPVPDPFADTGPTYLWISDDNEERGNMTSCGASGMSGAGGCS